MIDWNQYETLKREWVAAHPDASPQEYELAMREITERVECKHKRTALRWKRREAPRMIGRQCLDCKDKVGDWVKITAVDDAESLGDWEDPPPYVPPPRPELPSLEESRAAYREYLASPEWRELRNKVMFRANELCEGCLEERAQDVHHLTYDNVREEFAFQLVALCRKCHARIHGKEAA